MDDKTINFTLGFALAVIIVFGVAGNISSFITWTKGKSCKNFSGTMYLRVLALSDTMVLCSSAIQFSVLMMFQIQLKDFHDIPCKAYDAVGHFCALISTWVVVSVTVQRTIAVCAPLKSFEWNSKRREIVVMAIMTFLFFFLNLSYGLSFRLESIQTDLQTADARQIWNVTEILENRSQPIPQWESTTVAGNESTTPASTLWKQACIGDPTAFLQKWHEWIVDVFLLFVAPFSFLVICNVVLLVKISRRKACLGASDSVQGRDVAFASMTARVVAISITHCLLVGPVAVTGLIPGFPMSTYIIMHVLFFLNHSVNFVFYSLFGTSFRRDWAELCCRKCKGQPEQHTETSSTLQI